MNKILAIFFSITLLFNNFAFNMSKPNSQMIMPNPEEIGKIMETDEFKEMMGELEKIFGETETDDFNKPVKTTKPNFKKPSHSKKKIITDINKSQKLYFEESAKNEKNPNQIVKKLSQEKREAFYFYINKFMMLLNDIQSKINSYKLGIVFKEEFEDSGLNNLLNTVDISINQIKSKKLYIKAFFLPMFTELRKKIINIIPKLKKLLKKINKYDGSNNKEILNIEYLKNMALKRNDKTLDNIYLNLNPLQKEINTFLNQDLKKVKKQITTIIINSLVKEAIVKKIDKKKQLEKSNVWKPSSNRYSGAYGRNAFNRSNRYSRTGRYSYPYAGNRNHGYYSGGQGGRSYPSNRRTGSWYNTFHNKQHDKNGLSKNIGQNSSSRIKNNYNKSRKNESKSKYKPNKIKNKINTIKSLANEIILLLNRYSKKYNLKISTNAVKQIYGSKLLSKIDLNLKKLKEETQSLSTKQKKTIKEIPLLQTALTKFIPLGVRLAKNFGPKEEIDAAFFILSEANTNRLNKNAVELEFSRYEEELINRITKKEREINGLESNVNDLKEILNDLKILKTEPQVNFVKIKNTKETLNEKITNIFEPWENIPNNILEQIDELRHGIGKNDLSLRLLLTNRFAPLDDQSLQTKNEILDTIDQANFPNKVKQILKNPVQQIADNGNLTQNEQASLKKALFKITIKLKQNSILLAEIMKITDPNPEVAFQQDLKNENQEDVNRELPEVPNENLQGGEVRVHQGQDNVNPEVEEEPERANVFVRAMRRVWHWVRPR